MSFQCDAQQILVKSLKVVFLKFGFFAGSCSLALCADTVFDHAEERNLVKICFWLDFWDPRSGSSLGWGALKYMFRYLP